MQFVDPESIPSTGNAVLDAHHRHIAGTVNQLYEMWKGWDAEKAIDLDLGNVLHDLNVHFTSEEVITRGAGYDEWKYHETLHHAFRSRMREVAKDVDAHARHSEAIIEAFNFFDELIFEHEFFEDQDFWETFHNIVDAPPRHTLITWDSRLYLNGGVGVDVHHERIVSLANGIHIAILEGTAPEFVLEKLTDFRSVFDAHYLEDRKNAETSRVPDALDQFDAVHSILNDDMDAMLEACRNGKLDQVGRFLGNQLKFWLLDHITYQHRLF